MANAIPDDCLIWFDLIWFDCVRPLKRIGGEGQQAIWAILLLTSPLSSATDGDSSDYQIIRATGFSPPSFGGGGGGTGVHQIW